MKYLNFAALTLLALILNAGAVSAQEISAPHADKASIEFESAKPGRGLFDSKEKGSQAELINAATYVFSAQSGIALEDMSSSTTQLIGSNAENARSPAVPAGLLFRFDGANFSTFGASSNGLISLGGVVSTLSTLNALNSVANAPKLAPFWDHLRRLHR